MFIPRSPAVLCALVLSCSGTLVTADTDFNRVGQVASTMLRNQHFNKQPWDANLSARLLDMYLETLDFQKLYLTQEDVDDLTKKHAGTLYLELQNGDYLETAKGIFALYLKRVEDRHQWIDSHLKSDDFTFDTERTVEISREKSPWPKNAADADSIWTARLEENLLRERLRADEIATKIKENPEKAKDFKVEDPKATVEKILKRYKRVLENVRETDAEEVADLFLSALTASYDPHTDYMSYSEDEQFRTSMNNSLIGIGALLRSDDDGTTKIEGIVQGGPADKSGELQLDDRVIGVDPKNSGEIVDIVYMKINKVVEMIRGEEGTDVRLKIIPAAAPATTREIVIKREKVELKDQLANGQIIKRKKADGSVVKLGWLEVPSFYADLQTGKTGLTRDVRKILERMQREGIDGLVINLRGNGGGSLDEAISLTGLFIKAGPVVQVKDDKKRVEVKSSRAPEPMYTGPLVVLTDKTSASASEIFAAALQDYQRAVIVGDSSTFGKGTVQSVVPVGRAMPLFADTERAGALKVTTQKFYRIAGGSTQLRGVIPDIILPSRFDALKIGEAMLKFPLPYDTIDQQNYETFDKSSLHLDELRRRSTERVTTDPEYGYIKQDVAMLSEQIEKNALSLNLAARNTERAENEKREKDRNTARTPAFDEIRKSEAPLTTIYKLTLDNLAGPLEEQKDFSEKDGTMRRSESDEDGESIDTTKAPEFPFGFDPMKREGVRIASDLVEISAKKPATVQVP
ncbi:MAG: carboxy terminal-processing peptidase [Verrucomicrobiales bacterium]